jgi:hypothetical protein
MKSGTMKYLKTYEQVQDIYPTKQTKYLIVTEDEKWYLGGDDAHHYDESNDGYIILSPVDQLEQIETDFFFTPEASGSGVGLASISDELEHYSKSRQVVSKALFLKLGTLTAEKIDWDRESMVDEIMYIFGDEDDPKYATHNSPGSKNLTTMSDEEIKKIFFDEVVSSEFFSRGEAEEPNTAEHGNVYIEKLPLKSIAFQFGAIRKNTLNI